MHKPGQMVRETAPSYACMSSGYGFFRIRVFWNETGWNCVTLRAL